MTSGTCLTHIKTRPDFAAHRRWTSVSSGGNQPRRNAHNTRVCRLGYAIVAATSALPLSEPRAPALRKLCAAANALCPLRLNTTPRTKSNHEPEGLVGAATKPLFSSCVPFCILYPTACFRHGFVREAWTQQTASAGREGTTALKGASHWRATQLTSAAVTLHQLGRGCLSQHLPLLRHRVQQPSAQRAHLGVARLHALRRGQQHLCQVCIRTSR